MPLLEWFGMFLMTLKLWQMMSACPDWSVKPFVEYGLGIQKRWGESFTAQGQAMVRSGGRNGIALTAGFKWTLGKNISLQLNKLKTQIL